MERQMVIGYIGNGKSTNRYHLPFLIRRKDKIRVKTIWQRSLHPGVWAEWPGAVYTQDMDDILKDPEIQVVVVTTPIFSHYELVMKVLNAGKHCVCEKPFIPTSKEARELFAAAREKGLILQVYQNRRFDADLLTMQAAIASGKLGRIYEIENNYDYFRPEVPEAEDSLRIEQSFLYTHGAHTVDQMLSVFGDPDRVEYDVRQLLGPGRMNDYCDMDFHYASGLKVSIRSSYFRVKRRPSFIVYGTKGMFIRQDEDQQERDLKRFYLPDHDDFGSETEDQWGILTYVDETGALKEEKIPTVYGDYGRYYDALYETILNGAPPLVKPETSIRLMEILETGIQKLS